MTENELTGGGGGDGGATYREADMVIMNEGDE